MGKSPLEFWKATPFEFWSLYEVFFPGPDLPQRDWLDEMMERFPDVPKNNA